MNQNNNETNSQRSVRQYIEDVHTSGALLLTGEWGSGKTHFLKQLAAKFNKGKYAIVHISLFGSSSAEEIEQDIKKDLCYIFSSADLTDAHEETENNETTTDKRIREKLNEKGTVSKLVKGLRVITEHFKDDSKIIGGIDSLINFNYWDFIDLNAEILGRRIVIIFDDFERCTIEPDLLLGIINEYSENIGIKVIIVANESRIKDQDKFAEYKEKVVYKTVKLEQNAEYVLKELIGEFDLRSSEYQRYLEDHCQLIIKVFNTSMHNNFRSLRTAINDFSKLYNLLIKKTQFLASHKFESYEQKTLDFLLEQFFAFIMEYAAGEDIYKYFYETFNEPIGEDENGVPIYLEYTPDNIPPFVEKYPQELFDISSAPKAIIEWVAKGIYNEDAIAKCIDAYFEKNKPRHIEDWELLLSTQILFLDSIDLFRSGYSKALRKAYDGDLTSEQYISLLHQIRQAKMVGIDLPEEPQYDTMASGFRSKDRSNEEEPVLSGFSGWAEEAAVDLKKEIESSIRNRQKNKKKHDYYISCLRFFNQCNTNDSLHLSLSESVEIELNHELIDAVIRAFKEAKNRKRREIASCFLHIKFSNYKNRTLSNILIQKLCALNGTEIHDPIGIANLNEFISEAKSRFLINQN